MRGSAYVGYDISIPKDDGQSCYKILPESYGLQSQETVDNFCSLNDFENKTFRLVFGPEQIVILDGFPRREMGAIHIKFFVVLPHNTDPTMKQQRPLLPRAVLSGFFLITLKNENWSISRHSAEALG